LFGGGLREVRGRFFHPQLSRLKSLTTLTGGTYV
jgi:hypothetical protein